MILGTILNATVQSYLRSTEITNPVPVTFSEAMIELVAENSGDNTADHSAVIPYDEITVLEAGKCIDEMTDPGGAESIKCILHGDKKKSKLQSFLSLPKLIQKALKGIC